MSLRTPMKKVLGRGSAGEGVGHWWVQRVTSVALIPLCIWFAVSLLSLPLQSHDAVRAWLAQPWVAVLSLVFVFTLAWHSKLGIEVIVEDYIHGATKTVLLLLSTFVHVIAAAAGGFAILLLALRS